MPKKRGRRRANGEGSVYKDGKGRWVAALTIGMKNGKPERVTRCHDTEKLAVATLTELRKARDAGQGMGRDAEKVGAYLERWLTTIANRRVRAVTVTNYASSLRTHAIPKLGHITMTKLTSDHVQELFDGMSDDGFQRSTIIKLRNVLHNALDYAVGKQQIPRNVVEHTEVARQKPKDRVIVDTEMAARILDATAGSSIETMVAIGLTLGLRNGEVRGLRWDDIDLDEATVTIRQTAQEIDGVMVLGEPKSASSARHIAIPPMLLAQLRRHYLEQLDTKHRVGVAWTDQGLVFSDATGGILAEHVLNYQLQRLMDAAGLPTIRFHDLRHACASIMSASGVEPRVVADQMGHASMSLTLQLYTHAMRENKRDAVVQLEQTLQRKRAV